MARHGAIPMKIEKPDNPELILKRLWKYISFFKYKLLLVFFMVIISSSFNLAGPYLIGIAIDRYIVNLDFSGLAGISILMGIIYSFASLSTWFQNFTMVKTAQETVFNIRKDLFEKIQKLPVSFFDRNESGDIMSRLTNDVDNISSALGNSITQIFSSLITVSGTIVMMVILSPHLTLISLSIIPLLFLFTKFIAKKSRKHFAIQQKNLGKINSIIEETVSGHKEVKTFSQENIILEKFNEDNMILRESAIKAQAYSGLIMPFMNILNNMSFALIATAGGYLAANEMITIGVIVSFVSYSKQFSRPMSELANQFSSFQSALAGAQRVFDVMDEKEELIDGESSLDICSAAHVEFKNVSFGYENGKDILKNIDIDAHSGKTIAFVGPTGAGKTTVINLLARFYDVEQGQILIDGINIKDIKRDSLRNSLGIILQDTYLFSSTIKENIRYGNLLASDEDIISASKMANAHHFIKKLPLGYDTVLTEGAGGLSQGQRQLLSIARTILADPQILVLDEATSNVDTRTEIHIQEALLKFMKGRTSFVIAHRLSTIIHADKIIVINDGKIIEQGNHKDLLELKGFYYELYKTQFERQQEVLNGVLLQDKISL